MHDLIRRTLEWVRLLFAPGTGKRRRLALVLAADFGIDLDDHLIGAQEVAA